MRPRPPRSKRTDTLFPYTTLFRSIFSGAGIGIAATLHPSFMKAHNAPHIWEGDKMRGIFQLSGGASMGASAAAIVAMAMASPAMAQERSFRSEEHTSELQSLMRISYAVFCVKKKNQEKTPG